MSFANIKGMNKEYLLDQDLMILSYGGLADNLRVTHFLSQLQNIALQKKSWKYWLLPRYQLKTCYCGIWEEFWVFCTYFENYVWSTITF